MALERETTQPGQGGEEEEDEEAEEEEEELVVLTSTSSETSSALRLLRFAVSSSRYGSGLGSS